jgi:ribonuclease P/MRP protein subunit POP5
MVRLKHRYLLVNILYPEQEPKNTRQQSTSTSATKDDLPYTVQFRRPGPEQLSGKLLLRIIREGVADLFGDYGSGMVTGSLVGEYILEMCEQDAATLTV